MKKKFILFFLLINLVIVLSSCALLDPLIIRRTTTKIPTTTTAPTTTTTAPTTTTAVLPTSTTREPISGYYITYEYNNGTKETVVSNDGKVNKPVNPTKPCATFLCWCSDEELNNEFNFSSKVNKDTTIYAKYQIDFKALTNLVSAKAVKANVQVNHINQRSVLSTAKRSIGSGEIIFSTVDYYYVLTNHHVIYPDDGYDIAYSKYTIEDAYGQTYSTVRLIYRDVNYDLALLEVKKESYSRYPEILTLASDVYLNSDVIAMGEPHAQNNTITYGTIRKWYNFTADPKTKAKSNVNFEVIAHDARIDNGSSGGALLDTNLNLIGVNFASGTVNDIEYSYSIPVNKIKEFLYYAEAECKIGII